MREFLIGLQFLTQLPIRIEEPAPRDVARSYYFYPLIGFLIGLSAAALLHLLTLLFALPFSITLVLAYLVWIGGGLHEDGLADVADAMGGWTRDERLRIMKDSRIGSFGASMLILALLAKYAALTSMDPTRLYPSIIIAHTLARWAFLPLGYFNRHANEGLGSEFMKTVNGTALSLGTATAVITVLLLCRTQGAFALAAAVLTIAVASAYFRRRLSGITGDCFGATFHFVEIATYAAFLA